MRPTNVAGRPFTWSFSTINEFETCPAMYAAKRFYLTHKDVESEHLIWGSQVHKALENRLKYKRPLPKDMKDYEKYCVSMSSAGGKLYTEEQIAINPDLELTGWFDKDAWGRGVMDVMLDREEVVFIYDWKTGKRKDNDLQLKIFCALASLKFPHADQFNAAFVWLNSGEVTRYNVTRDDMPKIWDDILSRVRTMEQAWKHENFPERPCGLCKGWCINTDCPEWQPKRR